LIISKKLILIVDDDAISRHLIKSFLKNENDYIVKTVDNARDCLKFIQHHDVDLIISDVEMGGLDGLEMSQILFSKQETAKIPVILSSIRDKLEIARKSRNYTNVKKVAQKPYDRNLLLSDLKEICH